MHSIVELPAWERLFKRIVWEQIGDLSGKRILDFGSGEGITANHFAKKNDVTAIEPSDEVLASAWTDYQYTQIKGDISTLSQFQDGFFDMIICHNVLEYLDNKEAVLKELTRVLKKDGILSIVKHNRAGRVMQMAVLLDDLKKANELLDGKKDVYGIRTFWDLQQNQDKHQEEEWQKEMVQLEMRVSQIQQFRDIAFFHHLLLKK